MRRVRFPSGFQLELLQRGHPRSVFQCSEPAVDNGRTFAFVAVILDCVNDFAKDFYKQWDFRELPGYRSRLFLSWNQLAGMMDSEQ